jgi:DNA-directed RNA polymerase specialized sigma24 family protein
MRTCCLLRYVRGLKYQEIATVMKISIETVKAHLHQARKRLIEKLGDGGKGAS